MRFRAILISSAAFILLSANARSLDITTRLLNAKPGEWTRRYGVSSHVFTLYVKDVKTVEELEEAAKKELPESEPQRETRRRTDGDENEELVENDPLAPLADADMPLDAEDDEPPASPEPETAAREYALPNSGEKIYTLQILEYHHGRYRENSVVEVSSEYIRKHGLDPDSKGAVRTRIEHKKNMIDAVMVKSNKNGRYGSYYFSDSVPANGLVLIEFSLKPGGKPFVWPTDAWGNQADEHILAAGEGKNANAKYGIPLPAGKK